MNPEHTSKTRMVHDGSEASDPWKIRNPNPNLHYVCIRKDDSAQAAQEASRCAALNYSPAMGRESFETVPFDAPEQGEGQMKIKGNRILMCCDKEAYLARRKAAADRLSSPSKDAKARIKEIENSLSPGERAAISISSETNDHDK